MIGYNVSHITGKMKSEKGLYQRVTRFSRGDSSALTVHQMKEVKKIMEQIHRNAIAAVENAIEKKQSEKL